MTIIVRKYTLHSRQINVLNFNRFSFLSFKHLQRHLSRQMLSTSLISSLRPIVHYITDTKGHRTVTDMMITGELTGKSSISSAASGNSRVTD